MSLSQCDLTGKKLVLALARGAAQKAARSGAKGQESDAADTKSGTDALKSDTNVTESDTDVTVSEPHFLRLNGVQLPLSQ